MRDAQRRWAEVLASPLNTRTYPGVPWRWIGGGAAIVLLAAGAVGWWLLRRQPLNALARRQERIGWLFISPWVCGFLLLVLGPMVVSLLLALTQWSAMAPLSQARFVGLDNFDAIFWHDDDFWASVKATLYYTVLAVPLTQVAALAVALLMNQSVRGIGLFRTAYFVPSVVTGVALVTLWITVFRSDGGLLSLVLDPLLGPLGLSTPDWFGTGSSTWAVPAIVIMSLWGVGGGMIIYLAGLRTIPISLCGF